MRLSLFSGLFLPLVPRFLSFSFVFSHAKSEGEKVMYCPVLSIVYSLEEDVIESKS